MCKIHFETKSCVPPYWQRCCTALKYIGRQPNCAVEQRARPIFDRAAITLGIGPHSSYVSYGPCCLIQINKQYIRLQWRNSIAMPAVFTPWCGASSDRNVCYQDITLQRAQCSHCNRCISYSNSVCRSVCLSVCPSHAGIVSKRRHVARCSLHRWIA